MSAVDIFTPIPSRPAPVKLTGAVAWIKRNLFADWASTVATITIFAVAIWIIPDLFRWAVVPSPIPVP